MSWSRDGRIVKGELPYARDLEEEGRSLGVRWLRLRARRASRCRVAEPLSICGFSRMVTQHRPIPSVEQLSQGCTKKQYSYKGTSCGRGSSRGVVGNTNGINEATERRSVSPRRNPSSSSWRRGSKITLGASRLSSKQRMSFSGPAALPRLGRILASGSCAIGSITVCTYVRDKNGCSLVSLQHVSIDHEISQSKLNVTT